LVITNLGPRRLTQRRVPNWESQLGYVLLQGTGCPRGSARYVVASTVPGKLSESGKKQCYLSVYGQHRRQRRQFWPMTPNVPLGYASRKTALPAISEWTQWLAWFAEPGA
jgi:hypothetical protein